MSGTYSKIYLHLVFSVKGRENLINPEWQDEIYKYIAGIIHNKGQKSIIVNGFSDHIHCLIGIKPSILISDLVRDIKNNSSKFINTKGFVKGKFQWQEGYGIFSHSESQIDKVYNYILNQNEHHRTKTFKEEYIELLSKFQIDFKTEFLFEWIE
ncbi:MAG: IS200/IS605 family transposase [Bacteroidetes bacterium]|nr:IS200/IS605 family transposase [Bacteroidota bacterium]